jgi:hypothetical protein
MRTITSHHDGHGLAESIEIVADDLDHEKGGGASHLYLVEIAGEQVAKIQFQHGPRGEAYSKAGVIENVLLAILADRMECFNRGPFSCRENSVVLTKVQEAMHWMRHRADDRAKRGVLGRNEK